VCRALKVIKYRARDVESLSALGLAHHELGNVKQVAACVELECCGAHFWTRSLGEGQRGTRAYLSRSL
jgi:hypothetical protein